MTITALTDPSKLPNQSQDQATFDANMAYFVDNLAERARQENGLAATINGQAADVNAKASAVAIAAQNAAASAQAAIAAAGVSPWVSGQSYGLNTCAISQINFQTYRRRVAGAGNVDPANDSVNWAMLAGNGSFIPLVASSASFDLSSGNFFKRTMNGNETWAFNNCPQDGYSWTVELAHVAGTLTLPAAVKTPSNQVYTFTPGKTHMLMFVTGNKGARIRLVAAPNYDN